MQSISIDDLHAKIEGGMPEGEIVVDVRTPEEFAAGHIPGAVTYPSDDLKDAISELQTYKKVYFICRSGGRSGRACEYIESLGWDNVHNVEGGYLKWLEREG